MGNNCHLLELLSNEYDFIVRRGVLLCLFSIIFFGNRFAFPIQMYVGEILLIRFTDNFDKENKNYSLCFVLYVINKYWQVTLKMIIHSIPVCDTRTRVVYPLMCTRVLFISSYFVYYYDTFNICTYMLSTCPLCVGLTVCALCWAPTGGEFYENPFRIEHNILKIENLLLNIIKIHIFIHFYHYFRV